MPLIAFDALVRGKEYGPIAVNRQLERGDLRAGWRQDILRGARCVNVGENGLHPSRDDFDRARRIPIRPRSPSLGIKMHLDAKERRNPCRSRERRFGMPSACTGCLHHGRSLKRVKT